jgi:hypothetical protein
MTLEAASDVVCRFLTLIRPQKLARVTGDKDRTKKEGSPFTVTGYLNSRMHVKYVERTVWLCCATLTGPSCNFQRKNDRFGLVRHPHIPS